MKSLGKIQEIKEIFNVTLKGKYTLYDEHYDGYMVKTDSHVFQVLIENGQHCCENWGYFSTPDDCEKFIGAELIDVVLSNTELNQQRCMEIMGDPYFPSDWRSGLSYGDIQFVDFKTNRGVYQLAVYNAQNGYYGHSIKVIIDEAESYSACI